MLNVIYVRKSSDLVIQAVSRKSGFLVGSAWFTTYATFTATIIVLWFDIGFASDYETARIPARIQVLLDETQPLKYSREKRLPLYLWPATDLKDIDEAAVEDIVKLLDERSESRLRITVSPFGPWPLPDADYKVNIIVSLQIT